MTNNVTNELKEFEKQLEEIREEWKHLPVMRGKKGITNILILRFLAQRGAASAWEMTRMYLELAGKWNEISVYKRYYIRKNLNVRFHRALKILKQKGYVDKDDSKYELTPKGFIIAFALFPQIIFRDYFTEDELRSTIKKVTQMLQGKRIKIDPDSLQKYYNRWRLIATTNEKPNIAEERFKLFAFLIRWTLLRLKINLDELSEKDLFDHLIKIIEEMYISRAAIGENSSGG